MRSVVRAAILLTVFLLVPIVPFLILGEAFEQDVKDWFQSHGSQTDVIQVFGLLGVLASDIFFPIPSSAVMTFAGGIMPFWNAVLASWIGLSLGSLVGFGFARWLGKPFASKFAEAEDLARIESVATKFGPVVLLLTRPLPILAEACVLLMGTTELSWRRFAVPVVAANLGQAVFYVSCGVGIENEHMLLVASFGSGTLPLLLALAIRRCLPSLDSATDEESDSSGGASSEPAG